MEKQIYVNTRSTTVTLRKCVLHFSFVFFLARFRRAQLSQILELRWRLVNVTLAGRHFNEVHFEIIFFF